MTIRGLRLAFAAFLSIPIVFPIACRESAPPDTPADRIEEARRYFKTVDLRTVVDALADRTAGMRPDKDAFKDFVRREIRWSALEETMVAALAKHFSAPELRTLADFQSSAAGKTLLEKLSAYQADIGPPLQAELRRVISAEQLSRSRLHWDSPAQDVELGPTDETIAADFIFGNDGPQAIRILSVATSCGCTTAKLDKEVYQPGEKGKIHVLFTKGHIAAERNERVTVTTDEANKPSVTLRLNVKIAAALKITPALVIWGAGEKAAMKTVALEIPAGVALDIVGVEGVPAAFIAKPILDKGNQIYLVHLTPRAGAAAMAGKFVVLAATAGGKVLRIPVYLRILPEGARSEAKDALPWDQTLWIAAQMPAEFKASRIPGALLLTDDAWDEQFEGVLARWRPGQRIVIYGDESGQAPLVIRRLEAYGLGHLHLILATE